MPSEESYKEIEGDWKDFRFRRIQPADNAAVFEQIAQNYVRDEAVEKLLGWSREMADEVTKVVDYFLKDGMSFLAEHIPTGKIAGVRITINRTPDIPSFEIFNLKTRGADYFSNLLTISKEWETCQTNEDLKTGLAFSLHQRRENLGIRA